MISDLAVSLSDGILEAFFAFVLMSFMIWFRRLCGSNVSLFLDLALTVHCPKAVCSNDTGKFGTNRKIHSSQIFITTSLPWPDSNREGCWRNSQCQLKLVQSVRAHALVILIVKTLKFNSVELRQ